MKIPSASKCRRAGCLALALASLALAAAPRLRAEDDSDRVAVMGNERVSANERVRHDAVCVMGNLVVDGDVPRDAVTVMGNNTVNGTVGHDVVAVMGNVVIEGTVGHDVVAVMADITLGPQAVVGHDVVSVGGRVHRDPRAVVLGHVVSQGFGSIPVSPPLTAWWRHGLSRGRILALGPHLGWLWVWQAFLLGLYVLCALVLPGGVRRGGDLLAERPGLVVLAALVAILALPVLVVLLLITVVGIPVVLFLIPAGLVLLTLFGHAGISGLVGRKLFGGGLPLAGAVFLGGLLLVLIGFLPIVGLPFSVLLSTLSFGCAVASLIAAAPRPAVPPPPAPPAPAPPPAPASDPGPGPDAPPLLVRPPASAADAGFIGLPRAGFCIRAAALLIDLILVGLIVSPFHGVLHVVNLGAGVSFDSPGLLPLLALYAALMWKLRGTTIGGIVFGLKVVRLDDRPVDWATAIVRALGCFLSLAVLFLGFFWIAFDREKQSWHDKIAGTVVVRVPKGVSLV